MVTTAAEHVRVRQVLCRIRAPIALLERQAARDKYRLQFRGEVSVSLPSADRPCGLQHSGSS